MSLKEIWGRLRAMTIRKPEDLPDGCTKQSLRRKGVVCMEDDDDWSISFYLAVHGRLPLDEEAGFFIGGNG